MAAGRVTQTIPERINHLRRLLIIHSYLYYVRNKTLVSDAQFDKWAYELVDLQARYPEESAGVEYERKAFEDFDGSTGFDLPIHTEEVARRALTIYELATERKPQID
ncbi:hypothetical protein N806_29830 [Rhodococcus sp. P27]|nr:hypothetical protein N806_29830 [Rhodococcus sp. P27]